MSLPEVNPVLSEDKKKVRLLRTALKTTVHECVSSMKLGWFGRAYPDLYRCNREELRNVHKSAASQLKQCMELEVDVIMEEGDILSKVSALEDIVQRSDNLKDTVAWRPSGTPSLDLEDHLYRPRINHLEHLQGYQQKLKAENDRMEQEIHAMVAQTEKKKDIIFKSKAAPFVQIRELDNMLSSDAKGKVSK